jgi:hypothetical protein
VYGNENFTLMIKLRLEHFCKFLLFYILICFSNTWWWILRMYMYFEIYRVFSL